MCEHVGVKPYGRERPFAGPVKEPGDKRAHGGLTMFEECRGCGARRTVNVNQGFQETSDWGPTREQRVVRLIELEQKLENKYLEAMSHSCDFMSPDGRVVSVSVSKEGRILLIGDPRTREEDEEIAKRWTGLGTAQVLIGLADELVRRRAEI